MSPRLLSVRMRSMHHPLSTHHVKLNPAEVHFVETGSLVSSVADKPLVTERRTESKKEKEENAEGESLFERGRGERGDEDEEMDSPDSWVDHIRLVGVLIRSYSVQVGGG